MGLINLNLGINGLCFVFLIIFLFSSKRQVGGTTSGRFIKSMKGAAMQTALTGCDTVVLESNHDIGMLRCGKYPYVLKRRILSDVGHLSNELCALTAVDLVKTGTTRLLLAHLSRENNIPELAMQASLCELERSGMKQQVDFLLSVIPEITRNLSSPSSTAPNVADVASPE